MNYYDASSAPAPPHAPGQPAPAPGPHGAGPHGPNGHPFAMMHHHPHHPHGHGHGHPAHGHPAHGHPAHAHYGHHPGMPPMPPPPMAPMMYHHPHHAPPHPMLGMPPGGPTPPPPAVPSHLPPGVRVPTPRAVSLEVQHPAPPASSASASASALEAPEAASDPTAAAAAAPVPAKEEGPNKEGQEEEVEDTAASSAPPSLLSSAPPSRTGSVEPVHLSAGSGGGRGGGDATAALTAAAAAAATAATATAATAHLPAPSLDAMMLAAASVAGTAAAAAGTASGIAGSNGPTPTSGNRLPAEEVASFLMTLKHRSVSPDLVDDTASCLASMKMPHLMPASSTDSGDSNPNGGGAGGAGAGNRINLGPGSVQTTEGQILKFRETARPLGLPMATPEDRFWLSDVSCFVRAHCCEFFVAEGQEDNLTKTRSKSGKEFTTTAGRRSKVTAGRVGIRCVFCRDGLNKVVQSTSFPNKIANIYSAIIMMQCRHFPLCPFMPTDVRSRLEAIKNGAPMAMPPLSITDGAGAGGAAEEDDIADAQEESPIVNVEGADADDNEEDTDKSNEAEAESTGDDDDAAATANSSDATVDITNTAHTVPASANNNTPGRQIYWSNSALKLGLIDTESDGIRFAPGVDFTAMVEKAQAEKIEAARKIREAVAAAAASESSAAAMAAGLPPTSNHFMPLDVNVGPSGSFDSQSDGYSISSATLVSRSSASAATAGTSGKSRKKKGGASKADAFPMPSPSTIEKFDVPDMSDDATVRKLMGATDLVEVGDKDLIPSYIFLAFAQLKRCALTEPDRVGCYKDRELGFTGMCCKHCGGAPGFGKYFPGTVRSLAQTTTSQTILKHVGSKCRMTPPHIRQAIMVLQAQEDSEKAAYARGPENDGRPRYGSRKVFFARLFNTLHSLPVPPLPTPEEQEAASKPVKKATTKKRSSSTSSSASTSSSSSGRSRKKTKVSHATSTGLLPSLPPLGAVVSEDSADMLPMAGTARTVSGDDNGSDQENKA